MIALAMAVAGALAALGAATRPGQIIVAAAYRFLLFYGGVFALIALTAAVGIGLMATDRIVMTPGRRVVAQAAHRATSLAALAFLVVHVLLEVIASRLNAADAVAPFLARQRTFYIGLGTIASDLILVIVASGFLRQRFTRFSRPWAWRAVHSIAYFAWLLSIIHGLQGGRTAKPYVDWSYGACVGAVGLALAIRMTAITRSREEVALSAGEPPERRVPQTWQPALAQVSVPTAALGLPPGTAGQRPGTAGQPPGAEPDTIVPGLPRRTPGASHAYRGAQP